jgi:molecular chaperone DnaK
MGKILGIDLGTTFSAMASIQGGEAKIVPNSEGERTTPSVIALSKSGERLVGTLARRQQITNPQNTIYSVKRLIGLKYSDKDARKEEELSSYETREASDGSIEIKMGEKWHKIPEISAMVLQKLKKDAEEKTGETFDEAIITCPAYFDDSQRKATKVAGEIAGFKVRKVINEPTAAALAYGLNKKDDHQIIVYDFGGGTFDVSVLDVEEDTIDVVAVGGDTHLGGDDFDQKIMGWVMNKFKKEEGIDLSKDPLALQRIKEASEKAKIELSSALETEINLPFITSDSNGPKHLLYKLTRAQFENLVQDYIQKSIEITKKTVSEAKEVKGKKISMEDIDEVILVGGQTRMPKIQEEIKKVTGKDANKSINPDEVVAIGAAVEAGILQGDIKEVLLLDNTPLSLGIETMGQVNTILIPKNTTYPTKKTQTFSTAQDNQPSVEIKVLQGERSMASDNKLLGRFILDGIPPAPRGVPQIEVSFDIDANGILNVSAKDKGTGREQSIRIEGSCGISDDEVERMKKEAQAHAEEDKKKKEGVQVKNTAETLMYTAEKTLKDNEGKISEEIKKEIEEKKESLKKANQGEDLEDIKKKTEELSSSLQKAGSEIYKQKDQEKKEDKEDKEEKENKDKPEEGDYKEKE